MHGDGLKLRTTGIALAVAAGFAGAMPAGAAGSKIGHQDLAAVSGPPGAMAKLIDCKAPGLHSFNLRGPCMRPYGDSSPFNTRLPASPRVAHDSNEVVSRWIQSWTGPGGDAHAPKLTVGTAGTSGDYDHPIYYSHRDDPTSTLRCVEDWGTCEIEGMEVRVPCLAEPAGVSDGHMTVIDLAGGWEYDFWQVREKPRDGGELAMSWGGRTPIDGNGLGSNATAAHFGGAAGIIRPAEIAAGDIDHALFMVVKCTNGESVPPAGTGTGTSCADLGLSSAGAPPMGAHFFLDMTDDEIDATQAPYWKKAIMRAAADYGLYVGDTGGGFLKTESGTTFTSFGLADPWVDLAESAGLPAWHNAETGKDQYTFDMTTGIDWAGRLRMVAP